MLWDAPSADCRPRIVHLDVAEVWPSPSHAQEQRPVVRVAGADD
jgi:hypothetical protein